MRHRHPLEHRRAVTSLTSAPLCYAVRPIEAQNLAWLRTRAYECGRVLESDDLTVLGFGTPAVLELPGGLVDPSNLRRAVTDLSGITEVLGVGGRSFPSSASTGRARSAPIRPGGRRIACRARSDRHRPGRIPGLGCRSRVSRAGPGARERSPRARRGKSGRRTNGATR